MSASVSNKIVRDGLILYLDAANNKSTFPNWGDLTTNGYNATLNNFTGQYFTTNNAGEINFNGINSYVSVNNLIRTGVGFSGTIEIITNSIGPLINNERTSNGVGNGYFYIYSGNKIYVGVNSLSSPPYGYGFTSSISGTPNSFNHYVASYQIPSTTGTMSGVFCINGIFENFSTSVTIDPSQLQNFNIVDIGRDRNFTYGTGYCTSGATAIVRIYNRRLSNSEILQNYNVTKSRFNLL